MKLLRSDALALTALIFITALLGVRGIFSLAGSAHLSELATYASVSDLAHAHEAKVITPGDVASWVSSTENAWCFRELPEGADPETFRSIGANLSPNWTSPAYLLLARLGASAFAALGAGGLTALRLATLALFCLATGLVYVALRAWGARPVAAGSLGIIALAWLPLTTLATSAGTAVVGLIGAAIGALVLSRPQLSWPSAFGAGLLIAALSPLAGLVFTIVVAGFAARRSLSPAHLAAAAAGTVLAVWRLTIIVGAAPGDRALMPGGREFTHFLYFVASTPLISPSGIHHPLGTIPWLALGRLAAYALLAAPVLALLLGRGRERTLGAGTLAAFIATPALVEMYLYTRDLGLEGGRMELTAPLIPFLLTCLALLLPRGRRTDLVLVACAALTTLVLAWSLSR
ncbi:MAG: hypothetical protein Q4P33_01035 [Flaviflexus sp.]|nr:hypothetical protein [Flaviflexus sp.]